MSQFLTDLETDDNGNGSTVTLTKALIYHSDRLGRNIIVPEGFQTDYASVPELFWNIVPKWGRTNRAAVIHDFLYHFNGVTRKVADAILVEAMEVSGVTMVETGTYLLGCQVRWVETLGRL